jgi:hypothetical protein
MALHLKSNTEDIIKRIEKKSEELIQIVRGKDKGPDARYEGNHPSVFVHDRELRLAVGEFNVLLKEVATLAKSS